MTNATMTDKQADVLLDRLCANNDIHPAMNASVSDAALIGSLSTSGTLPAIRKGLKEVGFSPLAIIVMFSEIMKLIQEYGPLATDLVQKVVERLKTVFGK